MSVLRQLLIALLLLLFVAPTASFRFALQQQRARTNANVNANVKAPLPRLMAKKLSDGGARGFGAKKVTEDATAVAKADGLTATATQPSRGTPTGTSATDADIDRIFQKYGIKDDPTSKQISKVEADKKKRLVSGEEAPFGEDVMAKLSPEQQMKIDRSLITGVSVTLTFVVLCGIGISVGALKVVFPQVDVPPWVDTLITNVLSPSFTPALAVFFAFSTSFGLFKFAQISSSQTVYKE